MHKFGIDAAVGRQDKATSDSEQFAQPADDFERRVREADITANTDVALVMHCADVAGNGLPPICTSLVPTTTVKSSGPNHRPVLLV